MKLHRRDVVKQLLEYRGGLLVIAGLGSTSWDITAAGDSPLNFPTWGAMGQAAMMGLGLALAQPRRRVLVITGDGEMLMGLGSLATIGVQKPRNLAVVVIDNERYGETGMQRTHTAAGVNIAEVAKACGFRATKQVRAVKDVWSGSRNSSGLVYPGYLPGAEAAGGWAAYTTGTGPLTGNHWEQAENVFKYMIFENPAWDFRSFDYDRDPDRLGALMHPQHRFVDTPQTTFSLQFLTCQVTVELVKL